MGSLLWTLLFSLFLCLVCAWGLSPSAALCRLLSLVFCSPQVLASGGRAVAAQGSPGAGCCREACGCAAPLEGVRFAALRALLALLGAQRLLRQCPQACCPCWRGQARKVDGRFAWGSLACHLGRLCLVPLWARWRRFFLALIATWLRLLFDPACFSWLWCRASLCGSAAFPGLWPA